MTEDGKPFGPSRYKEISKERYLISKHTNTSYEDTGNMSPLEREFMLEFLMEDFQRQKEMYDKAQADAETRLNERRR